jgi:hypothetical protein
MLFTGARTGGTFLAHCLDSHPDIRFDRAEPIHKESVYRKTFPHASVHSILAFCFHQPGCQVAGCKVVYAQAWDNLRQVLDTMEMYKPRVIHLRRENVLARVTSYLVAESRMEQAGHPMHLSYTPLPVHTINPDPEKVVELCVGWAKEMTFWVDMLEQGNVPTLDITYQMIVGGQEETTTIPEQITSVICDFIDVPTHRLKTKLRRNTPQPFSELYENWDDTLKALYASEVSSNVESWLNGRT